MTPSEIARGPLLVATLRIAAAIAALAASPRAQQAAPEVPRAPLPFELPCEGYARGLRNGGNFGVRIDRKESPFHGSWHLAEDVWLPPGTPVRSVADGVVRYSDWSPSWTDAAGHVHWNLGNVIVVEHALDPPIDGMTAVCSFHVHLGADRRVKVGDAVTRGQQLGVIGKDRSDENGLYPAHLHFGLHRGPYLQIPPAWRAALEDEARTTGLVFGAGAPLRGEIEIARHGATDVLIRGPKGGTPIVLSLLVGSTSPGHRPPDIMCWCEGYGGERTVADWLPPRAWIAAHAPPADASKRDR